MPNKCDYCQSKAVTITTIGGKLERLCPKCQMLFKQVLTNCEKARQEVQHEQPSFERRNSRD